MSTLTKPQVLAIDGGGTHCRFVVDLAGERHECDGGMANVSTDFDGSVAGLKAGIATVAERAGLTGEQVYALPAFVGLAGVTGPSIVGKLRSALSFRSARFADDRPAALRGALGERQGVIAHCGTGSFFAAAVDGQTRFAGGWGPILGDEASAQWMGKRLLAATLQVVDGFQPASALTDAVLSQFGDAAGIVRFAGTADPQSLGALAPMVTDRIVDQDPTALSLMHDASAAVAENLRWIGWSPGLTICLTGGIAPCYKPFLPEEMQVDVSVPDAEPIDGALALARDHAGEVAP